MMLRHDAPLRVTFITNGPRKTYTRETRADLLDGCLTVEAVCNGKVSGMDSGISVKYNVELIDPSYELKDGELCTCTKCVPPVDAERIAELDEYDNQMAGNYGDSTYRFPTEI